MSLAGLLHISQLFVIELRMIDVSPVIWRSIHREIGRNSAIGPDDYVILSCPAIPLGKTQIP